MITSTHKQTGRPRVFRTDAGAEVQKGEHAKLSSFIGAIAVADLVKTTLGPKGMDKMLTSMAPGPGGGDVVVTNDGATILKKVPVDNPAAKILVNISMTQDAEVGDGTTTVVVLAGELLREAEKLTNQKLHPQTIIRGWRRALIVAQKALDKCTRDHSNNFNELRKDLFNIARTTLSSKIVTAELDFFAELCVKAVLRLKGSIDLDMIQIVKKQGASMKDSFLDDGFILDKKFGLGQSTVWENPKIMVANTAMDTDKIKIWGARVRVHSMAEVAEIEKAEKMKMKMKVDKILQHDINLFINRQLIYDYPEQLFTDVNVGSIEHADFEGVERLARVLGAEIMSTFDLPSESADAAKKDNTEEKSAAKESAASGKSGAAAPSWEDKYNKLFKPASAAAPTTASAASQATPDEKKESPADATVIPANQTYLGSCARVEEIMIGEDTVIKFSGVPKGEACTIVLRGASPHMLDEMERSIHDAICVLTSAVRESRTVLGGGASEMLMAHAVEQLARKTGGKEALAIDAFAQALRNIPVILADNAGLDSAEIVTNLRSEHAQGRNNMGVDVLTGGIGDMRKYGVTEAYKSKLQSLVSAHEAAEMILRVDDIVKCAPRQRSGH